MTRRQLSLYVPERAAAPLEALRRELDPVQHALIPAHVTLCREDEIDDAVRARLGGERFPPLTLTFGRAEPFLGHGILFPCIAGEDAFRTLREAVLGRSGVRRQPPHITLAHPRNPKAQGNDLAAALALPATFAITFDLVRLIEQRESLPWSVLTSVALGAPSD